MWPVPAHTLVGTPDTRVCVQYGFIYAFMGPCRYIKLVPFPTYVLTPCVYRNKIIDNIAIIATAPSQCSFGVDCSCYSFIIAGILGAITHQRFAL